MGEHARTHVTKTTRTPQKETKNKNKRAARAKFCADAMKKNKRKQNRTGPLPFFFVLIILSAPVFYFYLLSFSPFFISGVCVALFFPSDSVVRRCSWRAQTEGGVTKGEKVR